MGAWGRQGADGHKSLDGLDNAEDVDVKRRLPVVHVAVDHARRHEGDAFIWHTAPQEQRRARAAGVMHGRSATGVKRRCCATDSAPQFGTKAFSCVDVHEMNKLPLRADSVCGHAMGRVRVEG